LNRYPLKYISDFTLGVVVPVFNEGEYIHENIVIIQNEIEKYFTNYEIIVVSDGSTDKTNEVLATIRDHKIKVIILEKNQGKGGAVRKGLETSVGDFILFIDGGLELHPREINIFLGLMYLYEADIVIGSKRHPQSTVFYPSYRRFLSFIYQGLVRLLFHINVTDTQVGIKIFRKEVIKNVLPYLEINSYGFDLEILGIASRLGYRKILEAPVRLDYFLRGKRPIRKDLLHTLYVGAFLLMDTLKLWIKLKKIPAGKKNEFI